MNLKQLPKSGQYYIVQGTRMLETSIRKLLLCGELEEKEIKYSSLDFSIMMLDRASLIEAKTTFTEGIIIRLSVKGRMRYEYLKSLGIIRN